MALEGRESRENLAVDPERRNPIRQALFRFGKDLEDCRAEHLQGAPLRLIQRRQVVIDLSLGHGAESCRQEQKLSDVRARMVHGELRPPLADALLSTTSISRAHSRPDRRQANCQQARECSRRRIPIVTGRVRRGPRSIIVTDGHEAEALAALRSTRHGRLGRFFLELVGWPVARPMLHAGNPGPSHLHPVHQGTPARLWIQYAEPAGPAIGPSARRRRMGRYRVRRRSQALGERAHGAPCLARSTGGEA